MMSLQRESTIHNPELLTDSYGDNDIVPDTIINSPLSLEASRELIKERGQSTRNCTIVFELRKFVLGSVGGLAWSIYETIYMNSYYKHDLTYRGTLRNLAKEHLISVNTLQKYLKIIYSHNLLIPLKERGPSGCQTTCLQLNLTDELIEALMSAPLKGTPKQRTEEQQQVIQAVTRPSKPQPAPVFEYESQGHSEPEPKPTKSLSECNRDYLKVKIASTGRAWGVNWSLQKQSQIAQEMTRSILYGYYSSIQAKNQKERIDKAIEKLMSDGGWKTQYNSGAEETSNVFSGINIRHEISRLANDFEMPF